MSMLFIFGKNGDSRSTANKDNSAHILHRNASKAKNRAVREIVYAAKDIGDAYQVTLALRDAYEHPELELYTSRINAAANSEDSRVGRHGMLCNV